MSTTTGRTHLRALGLLCAPFVALAVLVAPAPAQADLASVSGTPTTQAPAAPAAAPAPTAAQIRAQKKAQRLKRAKAFGRKAVRVAATRKGSSYSYGAAGPRRFDCSGLTMWTFKRLGKKLPHSSAAQYGRVKHLRAKDRRAGDLVFFHDGGGIYHVAIYAGKNQIWHAPYSGTRVRKERIWTRSVYYGRVR
ncbi:cell wall-associated NlpC family hydrolase [Marmoricola sp. OAE513]|uniref:C40 family peptidase n=1 Tax=Marmoricola sp. OAE513 TaxID=2817894 RepID=UPI001AEB8C61